MLMHPIAGIEYRQSRDLLQKVRRSRRKVAQNNALGPQGAQRDAGIFERFALFYRGGLGADEGCIRTQALGRQLERGASASAGLVEQQSDPPTGEPPGATSY